jgi:hypothetical protein
MIRPRRPSPSPSHIGPIGKRAADPIAAAEHIAHARAAAEQAGFGSLVREVAALEVGEVDIAGDSGQAHTFLATVLGSADGLDDQSRRAYRAGVIDLQQKIDEAGADHDPGPRRPRERDQRLRPDRAGARPARAG